MDKIQNNDAYGLKRLESKNAKNAIIQKLAHDFNLTLWAYIKNVNSKTEIMIFILPPN